MFYENIKIVSDARRRTAACIGRELYIMIWETVPEIHEFCCYCTPNLIHQNILKRKTCSPTEQYAYALEVLHTFQFATVRFTSAVNAHSVTGKCIHL